MNTDLTIQILTINILKKLFKKPYLTIYRLKKGLI